MATSRDGTWVATGCLDLFTRILDAATGGETFRCQHDGWVRALAFAPTGSILATGASFQDAARRARARRPSLTAT